MLKLCAVCRIPFKLIGKPKTAETRTLCRKCRKIGVRLGSRQKGREED
jgi:hypothetical protein